MTLRERENYFGLTTPVRGRFLLWLWRRLLCPRNMHAFDEVHQPAAGWFTGDPWPHQHYLSCDACGLLVQIGEISEVYCDPLS